jgi:hypothetical protein
MSLQCAKKDVKENANIPLRRANELVFCKFILNRKIMGQRELRHNKLFNNGTVGQDL